MSKQSNQRYRKEKDKALFENNYPTNNSKNKLSQYNTSTIKDSNK